MSASAALDPYGDHVSRPEDVGAEATTFRSTTRVIIDRAIRCSCNKLLMEYAARPWRVRCPRCKLVSEAQAPV